MFKNEPLTDFTIAANRDAFAQALAKLDTKIRAKELQAWPLINGEPVHTSRTVNSVDPSSSNIIVGIAGQAGRDEAARALQIIKSGKSSWRRTPVKRRCEILIEVASRMRAAKHDLSALIVREAGKPWKEADGDVAEAIDFCDYYAQEMLRLGQPQKTMEVPGEDNFYFYQPRGIALVIAPWNFPLAIACGMATAALVAGNPTILKPSEQTILIAYEFSKILLASGIPADAFAFLPGKGSEIGRQLVESPDVDVICFTGSKEVGLEIINKASVVNPGQQNVKKVIAEMGGKNAVIVDDDADFDEAIKGVLTAAFGYSGQKCSACSRLIVVGDAYEPFITRLVDAASNVLVGLASDPAVNMGPVIDEPAQKRIKQMIEAGKSSAKLAFEGKAPSGGYFVPPTIFRDVATTNPLWREEIFGPVLTCLKAKNFDDAINLANDCEYALTGGLFSRSPSHIEQARNEFSVGNLYINRSCTGALVCRQPFGGFKMSGVGSKAGGPDYLVQFLEPRTVTENTMRRGFAPSA